MKLNSFFLPTLKEKPNDAHVLSHELMLRAGLMRKSSSGFYVYLPYGLKVLKIIQSIIRNQMNAAGAQEFSFPIIINKKLWTKTNRWNIFKKELFRIKDRNETEYALGPTHEEAFTDLVQKEINSYKQLPINFYQIKTKFRDEIRTRYGIMRSKEFLMKDAYSFHLDENCLDKTYQIMSKTYKKIFSSCQLDFVAVSADSGSMGGAGSEEFMVKSEIGEEIIITCKSCQYAANIETAQEAIVYSSLDSVKTNNIVEKVPTPGQKSIEAVCSFLEMKFENSIKSIVYEINNGKDKNWTMICIRGDYQINETKLINEVLKENPEADIYLAPESVINKIFHCPLGYLGPWELKITEQIRVLLDITLKDTSNLCCGANEKDYHFCYLNINQIVEQLESKKIKHQWAELYSAKDKGLCIHCGEELRQSKGIEVGHIFKLGKKYTSAMQATVLNEKGKSIYPIMGCYGIGVDRTLAAIIEQHHDSDGIIFPVEIAPFPVVIITVNMKHQESVNYSEKLYDSLKGQLRAFNRELMWDNREERAGFKFKDADLVGYPLQIIIGAKALERNQIELKIRKNHRKEMIAIDLVENTVLNFLKFKQE